MYISGIAGEVFLKQNIGTFIPSTIQLFQLHNCKEINSEVFIKRVSVNLC